MADVLLDAAATRWLAAHWSFLQQAARRILPSGRVVEADDAVSLAAESIWRHWSACHDDDEERKRWAATITKRKALDLVRAQQRDTSHRVFLEDSR